MMLGGLIFYLILSPVFVSGWGVQRVSYSCINFLFGSGSWKFTPDFAKQRVYFGLCRAPQTVLELGAGSSESMHTRWHFCPSI